jgi:Sec-independent protein translocase protein TatA
MFGINFSEFLVILCIVVIFVRPKDLPKFFHSIGKIYGQIRETYKHFCNTKEELLQDLKSEIDLEEMAVNDSQKEQESFDPYANLISPVKQTTPANSGEIRQNADEKLNDQSGQGETA